MTRSAQWLRVALALFLAWAIVACTRPIETPEGDGLDLTLRFDVPGQACLDAGFVGWMVEVRAGSASGALVASAYIEPYPWTIEGDFIGLDGEEYIFSDYWVGVLPAGDYHVLAYGLTDPGPPPVIATFMTPAEAMVTLEEGRTTEIVLVTSCDSAPGALDVVVVVDGGPTLLDFDIDMKWVAACQPTTFTATIANPEHALVTALWEIRDEGGAVVLSETQTFPLGSPDPIVTSFVAWLPTPGDYTGRLTVTSGDSTSVFQFPWHVRYPGIAVGACTNDGDPVVLLSCDPDDGLPLADDPACLDAAYGSTNGVLPTCDDLVQAECFDDSDGDGCPDDEDPCPHDNPDDTDEDGVCDSEDVCPGGDDDTDTDGDGTADFCDPCPLGDADADGVCDDEDACPGHDDSDDGDLDGQPDACDPCPYANPDDEDQDGICDNDDQYHCRPGDPDTDGDGLADACDLCPLDNPDDSDHDDVCDSDDVCPGEPDVDADDDGTIDCLEHECTTDCTFTQGYWKNHPEAWPVESLLIGNTTYTKAELLVILGTPTKGDASYILIHQLISARLNVAAGADATTVATTLAQADTWFRQNRLGSNPSGLARQKAIDLAAVLDEFNNGLIGPGHCYEDCSG